MSKQTDFIEKIKDGAIATHQKYGILASLTIAQAALETGWGKCAIGNNIFGIKASTSWAGKTQTCQTSECINGEYIQVDAAFRDYDSVDESIIDHAMLFVNNDRYANILGCEDYKQACQYVHDDGYATDPDYADKLISIIEGYSLTQYDSAEPEPDNAQFVNAVPVDESGDAVYTVASGDTLSGIASRYGTTYQALAEYNGIADPNKIYVGQQIRFPAAPVESAPEAEPVAAEPEPAPVEEAPARTHTVTSGESLWQIAQDELGNGSRYPEIKSLNGLDGDTIYPGQVLTIPAL